MRHILADIHLNGYILGSRVGRIDQDVIIGNNHSLGNNIAFTTANKPTAKLKAIYKALIL